MRWKVIAGAVGALALSAAGTVPARAASPAWQDWWIHWNGQAKVWFAKPSTWQQESDGNGYRYVPPSNYYRLTVVWTDLNARLEMDLQSPIWHLTNTHPVVTDGLSGYQASHTGSYYVEYIRTIQLPDGHGILIKADLDQNTRLGPPLQIWHRIIAPLSAPSEGITLPGATQSGVPTATGTTFQYGTPVIPLNVSGPNGQTVETWAEIDTGNEGDILITPGLAQEIGLTETGSVSACGVNNCSQEPMYSGLSLGALDGWQLLDGGIAQGWRGTTGGGYKVQLDIGPRDLPGFRLHVSNGRWTLTWNAP